jgi:SAM-dependent methyltransferase
MASFGANTRLGADAQYYSHLRWPLLALTESLPKGRVLEIGCGSGETLNYLKEKGAELAIGVELRRDVAQIAERRSSIDSVIVGNIETIEMPYSEGYFDLIVASFVLEHVRDPWEVTKRLAKLLKPGGYLVGSLPNVRHWSVVAPLLFKGRWQYIDEGIMDWTHLRFFSRHTIEELLSASGLILDINKGEIVGRKSNGLNVLTLGLMSDLCAFAFNFRAKKPV